MRSDIITVAAIIAIGFAAQAARNGEIKGSVTQKGREHRQDVAPAPAPTPTPTATSSAARSINESGISAPSGPPPKKTKPK